MEIRNVTAAIIFAAAASSAQSAIAADNPIASGKYVLNCVELDEVNGGSKNVIGQDSINMVRGVVIVTTELDTYIGKSSGQ